MVETSVLLSLPTAGVLRRQLFGRWWPEIACRCSRPWVFYLRTPFRKLQRVPMRQKLFPSLVRCTAERFPPSVDLPTPIVLQHAALLW